MLRRLTAYAVQRRLAGETVDALAPDLRRRTDQAFDPLESGIGDYCTRRETVPEVPTIR